MLQIQNVAMVSDLLNLSKNELQDICTNIDIDSDGTVGELAPRIWERIAEDRDLQIRALESNRAKILAGKTSVTWYELSTGTLRGVKEELIRNAPFNPFEQVILPPRHELTSTPTIISACAGETDSEYFLRFIYKSGVSRHIYGTEMITTPRSSIGTVYINEDEGIIEIRTEPKTAKKIATSFAGLIRQQLSISEKDIITPFGSNVEALADALGGQLFEAAAKPETLLDDFSEQQATAVVTMLSALDSYFMQGNGERLQEELQLAKEAFGDDLPTTPFTALILTGMERIGMGVSDRDLRGLPLYDFLKPYLQHQGGFIQFPIHEDGVEVKYTIRVGITTNSIYFVTPASEKAIQKVRAHVII